MLFISFVWVNMDTSFVSGVVRSDTGAPTNDSALYDNPIISQPLSKLNWCMRLLNLGAGVLLVACGVLGLLSAFNRVLTVLSSVLLSVYATGFGGLLLWYELAPAAASEVLQERFGFMYTYPGRGVFLFLSANLTWTLAPLGWITALLVNADACLHLYVVFAHRDFTSGAASRAAIIPPSWDQSGSKVSTDHASTAAHAQAGDSAAW